MAPPGCFVSSFRGHRPSHPARTELVDDLVEEVLLRIPPANPEVLVRAALACKRWHGLIGSPRFRSLYGDFHRGTRLLGFLVNIKDGDEYLARYIPAPPRSAPLRVVDIPGWRAVHSCHGRVLLSEVAQAPNLTIWDPVTDERRHVDSMPRLDFGRSGGWNAAVVCAAHGGTCNHLECRGGDSLVVLVGEGHGEMSLCMYLYSTQTAQWSKQHLNFLPVKGVDAATPALVGSFIYFGVDFPESIVGLDLGTKKTVTLVPPAVPTGLFSTLFSTEDDRLGFAHVVGSTITLWSLVVRDTATWTCDIVLDSLPVFNEITAFTHVAGLSLAGTVDGVYRLEPEGETEICKSPGIYNIVPYVSIYKPEKVDESRDPDPDAYNANIV